MRALKIVGLIVAGLLGLLVIGAAAVLFLVEPNDYRDDIEQRVAKATGRTLKIGGELDLKLFPWIALKVEDVTLGNPPGYGDEPFLTIKRADVGVKLIPLLRKEIEVRRVALDSPMVTLVSRGEAHNNWKDLAESDQAKDKSTGSSPLETRIAGVDVEKAMLIYRDEEKKEVTRLTNLELHTGTLGGSEPTPVRLEFDYDDGSGDPPMRVATEARLRLSEGGSRIELKELVAKTGALAVRGASVVLDTQAETLAPTTFNVTYGDLPIKLTAAGEKLFGDRIVTGKMAIDRVSLRKLLPSFDMEVPHTADPKALTAFALRGDYRLTENALQLQNLDLTLDDTQVRGTLAIDDLETKSLSFDLGIDTINVDRYLEPDEKASGAQTKVEEPTELPIEALRELVAHGVLRIGHAQLADLKFDNVRLPVDAAGGRVVVMPQARLFGGTYAGDIMLDARPATAKLSLNEKARGIDIGALVNAAFDTRRVTGRGDANAVLTGTGNTDAAILASLSGKIDVDVKDGAFNGVDLWYELRRALALVKRTAAPTRVEPARTQFKTFAGSATLADGIVRNDDLNIDADYLKARGKGTLSIASKAVDYRLVAEIYKLPAEGAGAEMADLKALEIPIAVTGTLADMKIRPDVADLVKARLRKEVDKRVDEKKEELKKKLDDKLKDLLGG